MGKVLLYAKISGDLKTKIISGEYGEGQRLPTEQELQAVYHVSRITVQKAMETLAAEGLVTRIPGQGTFVKRAAPLTKAAPSVQKGGLIGLVMSGYDGAFGNVFTEAVIVEARQHGLYVVCGTNYTSQDEETQIIRALLDNRVKGLIVMPVYDKFYNAEILRQATGGFPMVFADRYLEGVPVPYVVSDNEMAAIKAVQHLSSLGHMNIALVSSLPTTTAIRQRSDGFYKSYTMVETPLQSRFVIDDIVCTMPGNDSCENRRADIEKLKAFYREHPEVSGLVCINYPVLKLCEEAAAELGLRIPDDLSIVTFDTPEGQKDAAFYTHIRQDEKEMGMQAVRMLCALLDGEQPNTQPPRILLQAQLCAGSSTKEVTLA